MTSLMKRLMLKLQNKNQPSLKLSTGDLKLHYVKVSKYGVFSGPYFNVFGMNTGKYGPEKSPYLDTFHAVLIKFIYVYVFMHWSWQSYCFVLLFIQVGNQMVRTRTFNVTLVFNPFSTSVSLLCHLKAPENRRFSNIFREYRSERWLKLG